MLIGVPHAMKFQELVSLTCCSKNGCQFLNASSSNCLRRLQTANTATLSTISSGKKQGKKASQLRGSMQD